MNENKLLEAMPPSLARNIAEDILSKSDRRQPMLSIVAAISTMCGVFCDRMKTPHGVNPSLIVIGIADTTQGKGWPMNYYGQAIKEIRGASKVHGRIMSGQEMIRTALKNMGKMFYLYDECQGVFGAMTGARSESYQREIGRQLLGICTSQSLEMSDEDRENEVGKLARKAAKAKKIKKESAADKKEPEYLQAEIDYQDAIGALEWIKNGCPDPCLSFLGATQHANAGKIINEKTMLEGLPGRILFGFASKKTPTSRESYIKQEINPKIISDLRSIRFENDVIDLRYSRAALEAIKRVRRESDAIIDDVPIMKAVIGRYAEMTERIASYLSVENGVIEVEAVEWAYQLVKHNSDMVGAFLQVETFYSEDGKLAPIESLDAIAARLALEMKSYSDWTP
ncbi:DUF3987 domain-containing protein [Vibrio crassostreae]|nr:DUF3987 domain-containing protein [Vibrio crassostreae]